MIYNIFIFHEYDDGAGGECDMGAQKFTFNPGIIVMICYFFVKQKNREYTFNIK